MEYEIMCPICRKFISKGFETSNGQVACSKAHADKVEELIKKERE